MKVLKLTPCVPAEAIEEMPVPSTNRNRNGCVSDVRMRSRSRLKRISSRFHTTLIARSSLRRLRAGTRTRATSCGLPGCPADGRPFASPGAPFGAVVSVAIRCSPRSPSAVHHPREVATRVGLAGLRVADRRAGVGHEDVVERWARDADRADRHAELGKQARNELLAVGHAER